MKKTAPLIALAMIASFGAGYAVSNLEGEPVAIEEEAVVVPVWEPAPTPTLSAEELDDISAEVEAAIADSGPSAYEIADELGPLDNSGYEKQIRDNAAMMQDICNTTGAACDAAAVTAAQAARLGN